MQNIKGMKILGNFMTGVYAKISMLKDLWEDFTKTKVAIKLAFRY